MKTCYIIGAGELPDRLTLNLAPDDFVIAADAGFDYLTKQNIRPHLVVGDFDSLGHRPDFPDIVAHSSIKDDTDTALAIEEGKNRTYRRFVIYGSLGGRLGHTVANLQTAAALAGENIEVFLVGCDTVVTAIHNKTLSFDSTKRGFVSVFSALDRAEGVKLKNLKYPLDNYTLSSTVPLGVSNEFIKLPSEIAVKNGTLIVMWHESTFDASDPGLTIK